MSHLTPRRRLVLDVPEEPGFRPIVGRYDVKGHSAGHKMFHHPEVGRTPLTGKIPPNARQM
jgi:hypothetical protein